MSFSGTLKLAIGVTGSSSQKKERRVTFEGDKEQEVEKEKEEAEPERIEDTFSDIDDDEVDNYLLDDEESELKEVIWRAMNKEYLEVKPTP